MSEVVFKYVYVRGIDYLWDIRVFKMESSDIFWVSGTLKAFEYRLSKRMSMIDFDPNKNNE